MRKYTKEQLENAIKSSCSIRQVLGKLGLAQAGGNYTTIKHRITEYNIDTSHFTGRGWKKGNSTPVVRAKSLEDILIKNSTYSNNYRLKNRLIAEGLKREQCERCNNVSWQGHKIPLELHHVNGVYNDHCLENLQLLCPNCHALTINYRAKNSGKV